MAGPRSKSALGASLAVALIAIGGCGGGGDGGGGDDGGASPDEAASNPEIVKVLETFFTTADPEQCESFTPRAIEEIAPSTLREDDPDLACRKEVAAAGQSAAE